MIQVDYLPEVTIAFSEKKEGNIDIRFGSVEEVGKNLLIITKFLASKSPDLIQTEQIHNTQISTVGLQDRGKIIPGSDGLITNKKGIFLLLRVADCIPIFLFDSKKRTIGLLHSGWRGCVGKIVLLAIERLMCEFGTDPGNLKILLGPSLQKCCNKLLKPPIQYQLPEWEPFIRQLGNSFSIDLPGFVVKTALEAGVKQKNIHLSNTCTQTQKNLFSYSRSKISGETEGRFAAVIGLR